MTLDILCKHSFNDFEIDHIREIKILRELKLQMNRLHFFVVGIEHSYSSS